MTTVDFRLDKASLSEDVQYTPELANPAVIEETYFIMPVRFCVDGVELFEDPDPKNKHPGCWLPLPVLGFGTHMLQAVREIGSHDTRKVGLAGFGTLFLARSGEQLSITSSITNNAVTTNLSEVSNAFRDFLERVRHALLSQVPSIQKHPFWNQWFSAVG